MTRTVLFDQSRSGLAYSVGPSWPDRVAVQPGTPFTLTTDDASGNQIREGIRADELDPARLFPVSGPVSIQGVGSGDAVGLTVLDIVPAGTGHVWTRPGLGFRAPGELRAKQVDVETMQVGEWDTLPLVVPDALHVGTLGVSPSSDVPARDVGTWGGNLDTLQLGVRCCLWVAANRSGAGVFAGDVHAAIGGAEICGTGIEVPARVTLSASVLPGWSPTLPVVLNDERAWVIGTGEDFEGALGAAVDHVVAVVAAELSQDPVEAYLIVSSLLEVQVCQVVNPHTSVAVSLVGGLDRALVPAPAWESYERLAAFAADHRR